MDERDAIIRRVQKILALNSGRGATEAEAQTAMAIASRLLAEHNLSMAEVEGYEDNAEEWITHQETDSDRGMDEEFIRPILRGFFFVKTLLVPVAQPDGRERYRTAIFGTRENVEYARWVYAFLRQTYRGLWEEYRARTPGTGRGDIRPFYSGVCRGLTEKLRAERRAMEAGRPEAASGTGTALALVASKLESAFRKEFPDITNSRGSSLRRSSATGAGMAAGRNINIARPVGHASRRGLPAN